MRGPNAQTTRRSRRLRSDQTKAEAKLWYRLRNRQIADCKFVRQEPIDRFVCDFVCREKKVIVEVDGGQHAESARDRIRDCELANRGYRVLRFWNNDVLANVEGVLEKIAEELQQTEVLPLTPTLSP